MSNDSIFVWLAILGSTACGSASSDGPAGASPAAGTAGVSSSAGGASGSGGAMAEGESAGNGADDDCLSRSGTPGALDITFGDAGVAKINEPSPNNSRILMDFARAGDGTLFGLGNNSVQLVLFHLESSGALDTSFGDAGFVIGSGAVDQGYGLSIDPTGKLLVAGSSIADAWVERFTAEGHLDPSFGNAGRTTFDFGSPNDRLTKVLVRKDGTLVAVGANDANGLANAAVLAFMDEDGVPLSSVGQAGVLQLKPGEGRYIAYDLTEQDDGALLVLGLLQTTDVAQSHPFWVKVDAQGVPVARFGKGGFVDVPTLSSSSIAITKDSSGVAKGWAKNATKLVTFDEQGLVSSLATPTALHPSSVALDCAGNVYAAGLVSANGMNAGALARFDAKGVLDTTFAATGIAILDAMSSSQFARAILLPDGGVLGAGSTLEAFTVVRYLQ